MRIALTSPYDINRVSGISIFVRNLEAGLTKRGNSTEVLTPDRWGSRKEGRLRARSLGLAWWTFRSISAREARWDAVHSSQPHIQSAFALFAARLRGTTFLVTYHSPHVPAASWISGALQVVAKWLLRLGADRIVCVSESVRRDQARVGDLIVPPGVEPEFLDAPAQAGRKAKPFVFVFAGRQTKSKGFFDLLGVIPLLRARFSAGTFRLELVGDVPVPEAKAREHALDGLADVVRDHGVVTDRLVMVKILSQAHALVLPSYWEGMPLVLMEAMAVGCVPIATRVGGVSEIVQDRETGLLIQPGDGVALLSVLTWAIENQDEVERIAQRALAAARNQFTVDEMVSRYERLYRAGSRRPGKSPPGDSVPE